MAEVGSVQGNGDIALPLWVDQIGPNDSSPRLVAPKLTHRDCRNRFDAVARKETDAPFADLSTASSIAFTATARGEWTMGREIEATVSAEQAQKRFPPSTTWSLCESMGRSERFKGDTRPAGIGYDGHVIILATPELLNEQKIGVTSRYDSEGIGATPIPVYVRMDVRGEQSH